MVPLSPGDVAVAYAYTTLLDARNRDYCVQLMTNAEAAQHQRFVFQRHRDEYLLTRGVAGAMLCAASGVPADAFRFERNAQGRPEIVAPTAARHLRFNLTNTDGLIACAVGAGVEVGIDAEWIARPGDHLEIAPDYFSPAEIAQLEAMPASLRPAAFFDFWTLKESYIKARGLGLAIPLDKFSFTLGDPITLACDPSLGDDGARWRFSQRALPSQHLISLCVAREAHEPQWRELATLV